MTHADLIQDIISRKERIHERTNYLLSLSEGVLNSRESSDRWSVLENIEHLNRYNRFYIPLIINAIQKGREGKNVKYKTGWLGNYFAKSMIPKEDMKKMNTFKEMNPMGSTLKKDAILEFIADNNRLMATLPSAGTKDLNGSRIPITISKWIKLRVLDMLRVLIYHQERHMLQIDNTLRHTGANR